MSKPPRRPARAPLLCLCEWCGRGVQPLHSRRSRTSSRSPRSYRLSSSLYSAPRRPGGGAGGSPLVGGEPSVVSSSRTNLVERSQSLLELARTVELSYPAIKAGCDVSFDEIWQLFLDSGFLYPEKVARLQPVIDELRHTVRT